MEGMSASLAVEGATTSAVVEILKSSAQSGSQEQSEVLANAIDAALEALSPGHARGFFGHCGYHAPAQSL